MTPFLVQYYNISSGISTSSTSTGSSAPIVSQYSGDALPSGYTWVALFKGNISVSNIASGARVALTNSTSQNYGAWPFFLNNTGESAHVSGGYIISSGETNVRLTLSSTAGNSVTISSVEFVIMGIPSEYVLGSFSRLGGTSSSLAEPSFSTVGSFTLTNVNSGNCIVIGSTSIGTNSTTTGEGISRITFGGTQERRYQVRPSNTAHRTSFLYTWNPNGASGTETFAQQYARTSSASITVSEGSGFAVAIDASVFSDFLYEENTTRTTTTSIPEFSFVNDSIISPTTDQKFAPAPFIYFGSCVFDINSTSDSVVAYNGYVVRGVPGTESLNDDELVSAGLGNAFNITVMNGQVASSSVNTQICGNCTWGLFQEMPFIVYLYGQRKYVFDYKMGWGPAGGATVGIDEITFTSFPLQDWPLYYDTGLNKIACLQTALII
jgi:hypothetical protein